MLNSKINKKMLITLVLLFIKKINENNIITRALVWTAKEFFFFFLIIKLLNSKEQSNKASTWTCTRVNWTVHFTLYALRILFLAFWIHWEAYDLSTTEWKWFFPMCSKVDSKYLD